MRVGPCKVVKGPVNPEGGCKLFVAKPAPRLDAALRARRPARLVHAERAGRDFPARFVAVDSAQGNARGGAGQTPDLGAFAPGLGVELGGGLCGSDRVVDEELRDACERDARGRRDAGALPLGERARSRGET